jgi:hypothetical protein
LRGDPFDLAGTIRGRPHRGIDMIPADGVTDTLVACWSGIVVEALAICQVGDEGCGGGFGNRIYIDLDGEWTGWTARYAHLASVTVQKGQKVLGAGFTVWNKAKAARLAHGALRRGRGSIPASPPTKSASGYLAISGHSNYRK